MEDGTEVYTFKVENPMQIEVLSESLKRDGYDFIGLRESFYHLPTELYLKAGKCQELLYWDFIHRGDEVLLVHAKNFKGDFFGLVAGFVETGETLEEAVRREVMEETHLTIKNLTYFGSQPWPYPCGLMVGFMAEYESGDIHLQRSELSRGAWFRYDKLPQIPQKLSIARRIIDKWLEQYGIVSQQP